MDAEIDLAAEHEALIQFLYIAPVGLAQISPDGSIGMINPISAQLLMPLSRDGSLTNLFRVLEQVAPDLQDIALRFAPAYGMVCDAMRIRLHGGGSATPEMLSLTLLKLDGSRMMAVLSDISGQVRRERAMMQNRAWIGSLLIGVDDYALFSLDRMGLVSGWNPSVERVIGYVADAIVGRPAALLYGPMMEPSARMHAHLAEADATGCSAEEGWVFKADGSRFWGSIVLTPLHDPLPTAPAGGKMPERDEPSYCLVVRDIEQEHRGQGRENHSEFIDSVTGLANRRAFFDAAEFEVSRCRRASGALSLVLVDLDDNLLLGEQHERMARDGIFRNVAGRLTASFPDASVVARLGIAQFAVLLPGTSDNRAAHLAEQFRQGVQAEGVELGLPTAVSVGVAALDALAEGIDGLLNDAGEALVLAKNAGGNMVRSRFPGERLAPHGPSLC